jgi:hypothetical protein
MKENGEKIKEAHKAVVSVLQEHEGVHANPGVSSESQPGLAHNREDDVLANTNLAICHAMGPPPYLFRL